MNITISKLSFGYYKDTLVFDNLNLNCKDNQTIALVGPSGCGKSTILRLCCGILPDNKEQVFNGNILINGAKPIDLVKARQVGFMFQEPALFPNLTVEDNIKLPIIINKPNEADHLVNSLVEKVGLSDFTRYLPSQLSGGMKTRVSLARTFITKPKLLLLDEPFNSLDIKWKFILYKELETLIAEYDPMVIMVTHDISEALLLSNHIFIFSRNGSILRELNIQKSLPRVFREDSLKELQKEYYDIQNLIMKD